MDRETKPIDVSNHKFVVKTYATAREHQAIQQAYFKGTRVEVVGEQPKISEINPGILNEVHQEMIIQLVDVMDGRTDDIVNRCLDLPHGDFAILVGFLDEIISKKKS
jgi:hypothetical protein